MGYSEVSKSLIINPLLLFGIFTPQYPLGVMMEQPKVQPGGTESREMQYETCGVFAGFNLFIVHFT